MNLPKLIELAEKFNETFPNASAMKWHEFAKLCNLHVLNYKVTEPFGHNVESIKLAYIENILSGKGYTFTIPQKPSQKSS